MRKQLVDNCPPFRPIMSAIKTPTYKLTKFHVPFLETITTIMYTIKNSFEFSKEIADQDLGLFMASLDVKSLFTNIPLEETICVCCDSLFSNNAKVNNINRIDFEKLLRATPLHPTLANAFYVSLNRFGLMNVLMNSNLHTTEDMLMTYSFFFVHLIISRNSNII